MSNITANPPISTNFANKTIEVFKMKTPYLKTDKNGIPLASGFLCFSLKVGSNSYEEVYTKCTTKVLQEVISKKLHNVNNIKITLTFDENSVATKINYTLDVVKDGTYGFSIHPDDIRNAQSALYDLEPSSVNAKDNMQDCIIRVLEEPNSDDMFAEIAFVPPHANKENIAKILKWVSNKKANKETIMTRDIIDGKFIISSVNNNGEYIYVSPESFR